MRVAAGPKATRAAARRPEGGSANSSTASPEPDHSAIDVPTVHSLRIEPARDPMTRCVCHDAHYRILTALGRTAPSTNHRRRYDASLLTERARQLLLGVAVPGSMDLHGGR